MSNLFTCHDTLISWRRLQDFYPERLGSLFGIAIWCFADYILLARWRPHRPSAALGGRRQRSFRPMLPRFNAHFAVTHPCANHLCRPRKKSEQLQIYSIGRV